MSSAAVAMIPPDAWSQFAVLPDVVKVQIQARLDLLAPVLAMPSGHCAALDTLAATQGVSRSTIHRWFKALRERRPLDLADKRRDSQLWQLRNNSILLPSADIQLWRSYCLRYQRDGGNRAAHSQMLRDWRAGKATTTQPLAANGKHPSGWSYSNLSHHAPSKFALATIRHGKNTAVKHRLQALTTRVGLHCGQYYVGDDVWHDHLVHCYGYRTPVRPLEASVLDLKSACQIHWGMRPHLRRADGTQENLSEKEVRWIVAATLRERGYRTDERGTTWLVEKGTFAIREALARVLHDAFGIEVESSAIMKQAAWCGAYGGAGGGNPRFKAALESFHSLRHNEFAAIPGQVGRNRDAKPDELAALVKYAEAVDDLHRLVEAVAPSLAAKLRRPVLTWHEWIEAATQLYAIINDRRDHRLEGWRESGHEIVQYRVGDQFLDEARFMALPAPTGCDIAAWGRSLAEAGKTCTRLLSPAEVWRAGKHELTPLPTHGIAAILGPDLAREQRVDAGEFVWEDADLGPGEWRYFARITTPEGRKQNLPSGEIFQVYPNPFAREELCVADAKGRFLGVAPRHDKACRADAEAMQTQFKTVAVQLADDKAEINRMVAPLAQERLDLKRHNEAVAEEAAARAKKLAFGTTASAETQAALLARKPAPVTAPADGDWL